MKSGDIFVQTIQNLVNPASEIEWFMSKKDPIGYFASLFSQKVEGLRKFVIDDLAKCATVNQEQCQILNLSKE